MRAALFRYDSPPEITALYLLERLFKFKPESLSLPVAPTREFWVHVLESKIKATILNEGDMIGWEDDEETVAPIVLAAKQSLLRAIPHILPPDPPKTSLCRLILEHGDYGVHNTSITKHANGEPFVASLYDWETACIAPALLSDPLVAASPVDLITDEDGESSVTRLPKNVTLSDLETYRLWESCYIKVPYPVKLRVSMIPFSQNQRSNNLSFSQNLYHYAPEYETAIRAGKDVRHLWFVLRDWRGGNSEKFFGTLGVWADERLKELGVA
ncbi:hypothetical protein MMC14_008579 [Varicellaria rhodocarpa]|nr:hypothetical protein [Varicellaria rhodocarpa]